jgi:hypothetical protein
VATDPQLEILKVTVPVGVAALGWLASHALAIRAQRKNFINQIKNDARKQIGEGLTRYQDWLTAVSTRLFTLRFPFSPDVPPWPEERWQATGQELISLFWADPAVRWQFAMEENEVLFPELKNVRQQLATRQSAISEGLSIFMNFFWSPATREAGVMGAQELGEAVREQSALLVYLHVHLQNMVLGPLVGRERPLPSPRDVTLLRLIPNRNNLEFGFGRPMGRFAFAWRRLRYGKYRPILDDGLQEQRDLYIALTALATDQLPVTDWWIQGRGHKMAVQILDGQSGRSLWLNTGRPEELSGRLQAWLEARSQPVPQTPPEAQAEVPQLQPALPAEVAEPTVLAETAPPEPKQ